jgi:hypothetical protein
MDPRNLQSRDFGFDLLDLRAEGAFSSPGSAGFDVGRPGVHPLAGAPVLRVLGWLDVHHPCDGHIKAHLRVMLPPSYVEQMALETMKDIVFSVFEAVGIPADETYEDVFMSPASPSKAICNPTDRNGYTDRLV